MLAFLAVFLGIFCVFCIPMGLANALNTMINTAYRLLMDTVFYIMALGSAGAALGMMPGLVEAGLADCGDLAVFTAMCMCWSGYLSTHVSMMDMLGYSRFSSKAILFHTFSGIAAGVAAHWLFVLSQVLL